MEGNAPTPLRAPPQCEGSCHDETDCSHVPLCRLIYEAYERGEARRAAAQSEGQP